MHVSRLNVYPIKSLDGLSLDIAELNAFGNFTHDRQFAIQDHEGKIVNGKSDPAVHSLRSYFYLKEQVVVFKEKLKQYDFELRTDNKLLNDFLSDHFNKHVQLIQSKYGSLLDNPEESRLTIIATESLKTVASWFGWTDVDEARRRFRANIEVGNVPAFWEDRLYKAGNVNVKFRIGDIMMEGTGPCPRCVVPSRHPDTGIQNHGFSKHFAEKRKDSLPSWSSLGSFGHYYQLATNCLVLASNSTALRIGDRVSLA
jgi:uncharacterized protein YcbX